MTLPDAVHVEVNDATEIVVEDVATETVVPHAAMVVKPTLSNLTQSQTLGIMRVALHCGLLFASFGAIAALVWATGESVLYYNPLPWFRTYTNASDVMGRWSLLLFAAFGAACAFLPGVVIGPRILHPMSKRPVVRALVCGALITEISIVLFVVEIFLYYNMRSFGSGYPYFSLTSALSGFVTSGGEAIRSCNLYSWFVTFPFGLLCAYIIRKRGRPVASPRGCKLHGYREGGDK